MEMREKLSRRGFLRDVTLATCVPSIARESLLFSASLTSQGEDSFLGFGNAQERRNSQLSGKTAQPGIVDDWLTLHPKVRDSMIWQTPQQSQRYSAWSQQRKEALQKAFDVARNHQPTGLADPPPNVVPSQTDDNLAYTALKESDAWPLYLAHAANSLAIEIGSNVPWTVTKYSAQELAILFDSREMFKWNPQYEAYEIDQGHTGVMVPSPPDVVRAFLRNNVGVLSGGHHIQIGPLLSSITLQESVIDGLFDWCRNHLYHYAGIPVPSNMDAYWQYRGWPPASRVISGTIASEVISGKKFVYPLMHWTAGCHGTVGFLRSVLRVVNIPVKDLIVAQHALAAFPTINKYLSHGDDLLTRSYPPETALKVR